MFPSRRILASIPFIAAGVLVMSGCSGKPENSPVIRKKFQELAELKEEVHDTHQTLRSVAGDITILKDEISNLRALTPEGGAELVTRLEEIEKRIGDMESGGTIIARADVTPTKKQASSITELIGSSNADFGGLALPKEEKPVETVAKVEPKTVAPKPVEKKTTAPAPAPVKKETTTVAATTKKTTTSSSSSRGRYYVIQAGDTLDKIATDNNISVAKLREANRLPSGARPLKGQRLYIPGG